VLNFNKAGGRDFSALAAINSYPNLSSAGKAPFLLPKALSVWSLKILSDDGVTTVF